MTTSKTGACYIGSPAEEFFKHFTKKPNHVSFFYTAEELRLEIKSAEPDKRTITVEIFGKLISRSFKTVKATLTVTPTEENMTQSCVKYAFEFERTNGYIPETGIIEFLLTYIFISDVNLRQNQKYNSHYVGYPANECFNRCLKAFAHHDDVKMEHTDPKKKTFMMSFTNAPCLGDCYNDEAIFTSIDVTVTVTPQKGDNSRSRMKWTINVEKLDDDEERSDYYNRISCFIQETIQATHLG